MTKKPSSFSNAIHDFYTIRNKLSVLTEINNALLKTKNFNVITIIQELIQKLQDTKQRLLDIKAFTDNIDHDHPCYDMDMAETLHTVKNQLAWLGVVTRLYDIGYVNGQESRDDNKKENPIDLTRIIEGLKEDRHNIVDLFFEKIQTYRNENLVYNLLVDMSDPTKINFRVETNNRTGRIQIPFFKAFTLTLDGSYADYTKDKLYTIVDERITTFERANGNPVIKKKITVTAHDTRRLVDLLSDEEAKYFLKEMAAHEAECTLDEGWLTNDHRSNTIFQSTYYKSLKTDQERQIYATAIGQQYALNLLCSPVAESLRTYDLDHLNTFFKAVELVID